MGKQDPHVLLRSPRMPPSLWGQEPSLLPGPTETTTSKDPPPPQGPHPFLGSSSNSETSLYPSHPTPPPPGPHKP